MYWFVEYMSVSAEVCIPMYSVAYFTRVQSICPYLEIRSVRMRVFAYEDQAFYSVTRHRPSPPQDAAQYGVRSSTVRVGT